MQKCWKLSGTQQTKHADLFHDVVIKQRDNSEFAFTTEEDNKFTKEPKINHPVHINQLANLLFPKEQVNNTSNTTSCCVFIVSPQANDVNILLSINLSGSSPT